MSAILVISIQSYLYNVDYIFFEKQDVSDTLKNVKEVNKNQRFRKSKRDHIFTKKEWRIMQNA